MKPLVVITKARSVSPVRSHPSEKFNNLFETTQKDIPKCQMEYLIDMSAYTGKAKV